jgi:2-dehydro-3-deoxygluconokinase
MAPSPDIVCLGEPLIEFNRPKEGDGRTWLQGFGGDSQNVAIAAARQGASTGYLTGVGQDWMGDAFLDLWKNEGVDASRVKRHPSAPTGVSFVTHSASGHKFDYLRKNSAASLKGSPPTTSRAPRSSTCPPSARRSATAPVRPAMPPSPSPGRPA